MKFRSEAFSFRTNPRHRPREDPLRDPPRSRKAPRPSSSSESSTSRRLFPDLSEGSAASGLFGGGWTGSGARSTFTMSTSASTCSIGGSATSSIHWCFAFSGTFYGISLGSFKVIWRPSYKVRTTFYKVVNHRRQKHICWWLCGTPPVIYVLISLNWETRKERLMRCCVCSRLLLYVCIVHGGCNILMLLILSWLPGTYVNLVTSVCTSLNLKFAVPTFSLVIFLSWVHPVQ